MKMPNISTEEMISRGRYAAQVLKLHPMKKKIEGDTCYQTTWMPKTALGLYRTLWRILADGDIQE